MKDLKNYTGSKNGSGVYQNIISCFPAHDIYIEPFLGSAAILKKKEPSCLNFGFDVSSSIIENYVTDQGYFYQAIDSLQFLVTAASFLNALHAKFKKILIYCDPPYPIESRRSCNTIYQYEMSAGDHTKFLDAVRNLNCYVVISSYKNSSYDSALLDAGWNYKSFKTHTRKGPATETIYYNFPDNLIPHQFNHIGSNFRERAAIKGRVFRNVSKINRMNPVERAYLLHELSKFSNSQII
jgi:site-specific DNA-adenine methylase